MDTMVYVIGLILFIFLIGDITSGAKRLRRGRGRRHRNPRRGFDDDDYYYDDRYYYRDRNDYYDDDHRDYRRWDKYDDQNYDYWGIFIGIGIILLIGLGIYQYNAQRSPNKIESAEIIMKPENPDIYQSSPNNKELDYSVDDYPHHVDDD